MIERLDHVNLRTADVPRLVQFYVDVLELRAGPRPPFDFPGAWLYAGERPVVHVVGLPIAGAASQPEPGATPPAQAQLPLRLDHFAFSARGLPEFHARLTALGVAHRTSRQPGTDVPIVNLHDCDGNRLHVDFPDG